MSKKSKTSKPMFTKKQLMKGFTTPSARTIMPEGIEVHSIHISIEPDKNGLHTIYDSHSNTSMKASRASIAAFAMAINAGEHHPALRTHLDT